MEGSSLNPVTREYEFLGPIGAFLMITGLPVAVLALYIFCNSNGCTVLQLPTTWPPIEEYWHPLSCLIFVAWFAFNAAIYLSPLGRTIFGTKIRDGSRFQYKLNGLYAFIFAHVLFVLGYCYWKVPVTFAYHHFLSLAVAAIAFSSTLSVYLYVRSFRSGTLLALGGNSSSHVYNFFIGRELNPRTGMFDWKVFCELRPGLIGWVMLNYCMLFAQYEKHGYVTASMVLVCAFQFWYILDSLWFEEAILTTMDVIHDGFGFMLAFGDLAWVPFTYSLQARFLVDNPVHLEWWAICGIVALKVVGYVIFRGSNSQKNVFRQNQNDPAVAHLKTMPTRRGTKLIVSGWWGICRHPNYVGDLMMALSWSLPCGFTHILPYFYPIYFLVLLIHRQIRDEHHCQEKYGKDWSTFCKIVKWRLIPGIY